MKTEILDLKHTVAESLIIPAKKSIEELQQDLARIELTKLKLDLPLPQPPRLKAEEQTSSAPPLWQAGVDKFGSLQPKEKKSWSTKRIQSTHSSFTSFFSIFVTFPP